jgi:hypothetical protein
MPSTEQLIQVIGAQYLDTLTLQRQLADLQKQLADAKAEIASLSPKES